MEEVGLVLNIPDTFPLVIMEFIAVVIEVFMMEEVNIGLKRPSTITLEIMEQFLVVMG